MHLRRQLAQLLVHLKVLPVLQVVNELNFLCYSHLQRVGESAFKCHYNLLLCKN